MKKVIEELNEISELLYQENITTAYSKLAGVIPGITQSIGNVEDEELRNLLAEKLGMALNAMENNDALLLADIIQYELVEVFENM